MTLPPLPDWAQALVAERLQVLASAQTGAANPIRIDDRQALRMLLLGSDYAFERLRRGPSQLERMGEAEPLPAPQLQGTGREAMDVLRRYRHQVSVAIALADFDGVALERTLADTSALAERCIAQALAAAEASVAERHGHVCDAGGRPLRLAVFALGKLGGGELNFSSDVDLVFGHGDGGDSDGPRPLDANEYFTRVGRALIALLSEATAEGFAYRVDMRLRPFGNAGRLALSFGAMEQYFQREGRDWERYAWIKAHPVAGDRAGGEAFLETLRPFVFRRYLDYTAFDGLREMKGLIAQDVQRRDLAEHLKLGPGGIREIEFVVQLLQLIRGGREPALRSRALLVALDALVAAGHLSDGSAQRLRGAYRFLRRLENRLQMLREEQTHEPPQDPRLRERIALGLGYGSWSALADELAHHRRCVGEEFERVFDTPRPQSPALSGFAEYWSHVEDPDAPARLALTGIDEVGPVHAQLVEFARSPALLALSARARRRLDRVLPALLAAAAATERPQQSVERTIRLLHSIVRRSSYLALLAEQPAALTRVVEVMARSAWLAERVSAHPLLLDDLLDAGSERPADTRAALRSECARALGRVAGDDPEAVLLALNEFRQSQTFRIALARLFERSDGPASARQLAWVAEAVVAALLPVAAAELTRSHGRPGGVDVLEHVAVMAYGSFGGCELGFGSDLDLVFLFDGALLQAESDGARPLDAPRWFARLMQRLVNLLGTLTPAGRLYEVDLRLRPDGARGLLVSSLQSFAEYQHERAWTWEHQALVRARFVAGAATMGEAFANLRSQVLARPRERESLRRDVAAMRARMRGELDRSRGGHFDLKHGPGGLVDLEFLLQYLVLGHATDTPALLQEMTTPGLLAAAAVHGLLGADAAAQLTQAHADLLAAALGCTLDARPRVVRPDAAVVAARDRILGAWTACGLDAVAAADP
ncbi:MAG TPA: bifunctional [glutamate--ammonia ligase]-adenylyl-L-tyrosine phosphorylase/[glutamate--ammonia-ligase] adenylyltransferase [Xanthomonadaceae bacterium]|nr:bifunctional [glutamate--ammonia ligase]-adenylyl-L-tyrosine phosphorylase/[glutamate--ammonia-ligase] adenylyltransferase [Xanthomonadaceae bacterium]